MPLNRSHFNSEDGRALYEFVSDHLYFSRPDIVVDNKPFNSTLLLALLTALVQGKAIIIGEPGLGKTTAVEFISSLIYRLPLGTIWSGTLGGHPEQTEEKIVGRPDLAMLNTGREEVVWTNFAQLPVKIVDEINRLPETKQSLILDGIDRGHWEYLNEMILNEEHCLFATANYQDRGTATIIAPLLDRFDVMVESKHPGPNLAFSIADTGYKSEILRHSGCEENLQTILRQRLPYHEKMAGIDQNCDEFETYVYDRYGLKLPNRLERQKISETIRTISFDADADAYSRFLIAELCFCYQYGQKRSNELCDDSCHYSGYLCREVRNCISNRFPVSLKIYSQALAWLLGKDPVNIEILRAVAPYVLAHRIQWRDDIIALNQNKRREDPLPVYLAKEAVKKVYRRYVEQSDEVKKALAVACKIFEGEDCDVKIEGDHPLFHEIKKDLKLVMDR